jgi:Protein of unknown function (DUF3131)
MKISAEYAWRKVASCGWGVICVSLFSAGGVYAENLDVNKVDGKKIAAPLRRHSPLSEQELKVAKVAWKYFQNNYQPETGLVNAVDNYPSTTMWDTASYMAALVSAYELGLITKDEFDEKITKLLKTFSTASLFKNELPNKVYHTKTAEKVNYANKPGEIGFSALDLGRFLIWAKIIKERYPEHSNKIDAVVQRWSFCNVVDQYGMLWGATLKGDGRIQYLQEGRLGYEEYSAQGFQLWGFKTDRASKPEPYAFIPIYGVDIPYDTRDSVSSNAWMADFAKRIYQVQEARYLATGILTARTEHQLDGPPYFVYDTIYTDGYTWNTITEDSKVVPKFASVALKGALGLWGVWDTEYTRTLFNSISGMYDPAKGFYEGVYEDGSGPIKTFTANNNGIMLETLLYKVQGKLLRFGNKPSRWESAITDEFSGMEKCLPQHRCACLKGCR